MSDIDALRAVDLNLLVSLDTLSRASSVTEAAKMMGVTQSAMSHQLKRLRELLDDPLFVTSLRPMQPTPRLLQVVSGLRPLLEGLAELTSPTQEFDPATSQRVFSLATTDLTEFIFGARAARLFAATAPHTRMCFVRRMTRLKSDLAEGRVDVAVLPAGVPGVEALSGAVRRRLLGSDDFTVVMRPDHPASSQRLTLKRYLAEEHLLVSPSGGRHGLVDGALQRMGHSRRVALQVSHFSSAPLVVAQSTLLATLPTQVANEAARHIDLVCVRPPVRLPKISAYAFWHERVDKEPGHRWFREQIFKLSDAEA